MCQYQIILPIFLHDIDKSIQNIKSVIQIKKFNININSIIVNKLILFIFIILLVSPSYNTFKEDMSLRMKPYINKDAYINLIETNKILERYEIESSKNLYAIGLSRSPIC